MPPDASFSFLFRPERSSACAAFNPVVHLDRFARAKEFGLERSGGWDEPAQRGRPRWDAKSCGPVFHLETAQ